MSAPTTTRPPRTAGTRGGRARRRGRRGGLGALALGVLTWLIVLLFFFPVLWMALTGFKQEPDAATTPPHFVFSPPLANYQSAIATPGPDLFPPGIIPVGSTLIALP